MAKPSWCHGPLMQPQPHSADSLPHHIPSFLLPICWSSCLGPLVFLLASHGHLWFFLALKVSSSDPFILVPCSYYVWYEYCLQTFFTNRGSPGGLPCVDYGHFGEWDLDTKLENYNSMTVYHNEIMFLFTLLYKYCHVFLRKQALEVWRAIPDSLLY